MSEPPRKRQRVSRPTVNPKCLPQFFTVALAGLRKCHSPEQLSTTTILHAKHHITCAVDAVVTGSWSQHAGAIPTERRTTFARQYSGQMDVSSRHGSFWPLALDQPIEIPLAKFVAARHDLQTRHGEGAIRFDLRLGLSFGSPRDYAFVIPRIAPGLVGDSSRYAMLSAQTQLRLASSPHEMLLLEYCRDNIRWDTNYGIDATVTLSSLPSSTLCKICHRPFTERQAFLQHWHSATTHSRDGRPTLVLRSSIQAPKTSALFDIPITRPMVPETESSPTPKSNSTPATAQSREPRSPFAPSPRPDQEPLLLATPERAPAILKNIRQVQQTPDTEACTHSEQEPRLFASHAQSRLSREKIQSMHQTLNTDAFTRPTQHHLLETRPPSLLSPHPEQSKKNKKKYIVPQAPVGVTLFTTPSMRPLEPGEEVSESDDDIDQTWDIIQHKQSLAKLPNCSPAHAQLLQRFDEELYRRPVRYNGALKNFLRYFIGLHGSWINAEPVRIHCFAAKLIDYRRQGILDTRDVTSLGAYLKSIEAQPPTPMAPLRPAHGGDCDLCGHDVSADDQIICTSIHCVSPYYHETCVLDGRENKQADWKCDVCKGLRSLTSLRGPPIPLVLPVPTPAALANVNTPSPSHSQCTEAAVQKAQPQSVTTTTLKTTRLSPRGSNHRFAVQNQVQTQTLELAHRRHDIWEISDSDDDAAAADDDL